MTQREAQAYLMDLSNASGSPNWICRAGDEYFHIGDVVQLSPNNSDLLLTVRYVTSSLPVTSVNTVTGEAKTEKNESIVNETYRANLRRLKEIRILTRRLCFRGPNHGRWLMLRAEPELLLHAAPPEAEFDKTVAALKALNPDMRVKVGVDF